MNDLAGMMSSNPGSPVSEGESALAAAVASGAPKPPPIGPGHSHTAVELFKAGFGKFMVPVRPRDKVPARPMSNGRWRNTNSVTASCASLDMAREWDKAGASVGLRGGDGLLWLDNDLGVPFTKLVLKHLGGGVRRFVDSPTHHRDAFLFRVSGETKTLSLKFRHTLLGNEADFGLRGSGQQAVITEIHRDTGKRYLTSIRLTRWEDVPEIPAHAFSDAFLAIIDEAKTLGLEVVNGPGLGPPELAVQRALGLQTAQTQTAQTQTQASPQNYLSNGLLDHEELRWILTLIPNDPAKWSKALEDFLSAYDNWVSICFAVIGATGGSSEGRLIFIEWSDQQVQVKRSSSDQWDYCIRKARTDGVRLGGIFLLRLAQRFNPDGYLKPFLDIFEKNPVADTDPPPGTSQAIEDYPLHWHGDPVTGPMKTWLVKDTLPEFGVALLAAQWGFWKTFVAFDLAGAVMTKTTFAGREVCRQGGVLFVAAEGQSEVRVRLEAIAIELRKSATIASGAAAASNAAQPGLSLLPFAWVESCPPLSSRDAADKLNRIVERVAGELLLKHQLPLALIVVDTMTSAGGFKDANDAAEAQRVMNALRAVARKYGLLVVVVDHLGKNTDAGTRGSSAKEDAADAILAIDGTRSPGGGVSDAHVALRKVRGAASGSKIGFQTRTVLVPQPSGPDESTLVVDWAVSVQPALPPNPGFRKRPKCLTVFLSSLESAFATWSEPMRLPDTGCDAIVVAREKVQDAFAQTYPYAWPQPESKNGGEREGFSQGSRGGYPGRLREGDNRDSRSKNSVFLARKRSTNLICPRGPKYGPVLRDYIVFPTLCAPIWRSKSTDNFNLSAKGSFVRAFVRGQLHFSAHAAYTPSGNCCFVLAA